MSRSAEAALFLCLLAGCDGAGAPPPRPLAPPVTDGGDAAASDGAGEDLAAPRPVLDGGTAACDEYGARFCERLEGCAAALLVGLFDDRTGCEQRTRLDCQIQAARPGSGFTAPMVGACNQALGAASCEDLLGDTVPACQVVGTLAAGAPCGAGGQCASGFCRMGETATCGQCASAGTEGDPCESTAACRFPLRCSRAGRCAAGAGPGDFCNETHPCRSPSFYCSAADNTCQPFAALGESCNATGATFARPCADGLICRPGARGSCVAIQYVGAGERCGVPMSGPVVLCRGSASCIDGTCRAAGADGERCTASPLGESLGCVLPAQCRQGRCQLGDPAECR
jgi:hypothetical protein